MDVLGGLLYAYKWRHPNGAALDDTLPGRYVATSWGRRQADRVLWCGLGRRPDTSADVPTIVVEVVSRRARDRRRDYDLKREEYREAGVQEYWIVDARDRTLTAAFADGTERVVSAGGVYTTDRLPGFELPVDTLIAAAERWAGSGGRGPTARSPRRRLNCGVPPPKAAPMSARRPAGFAVLAALLIVPAAPACLWDTDTLWQERRAFPGTLELIVGKFAQHTDDFYEWRVRDRRGRLALHDSGVKELDDETRAGAVRRPRRRPRKTRPAGRSPDGAGR